MQQDARAQDRAVGRHNVPLVGIVIPAGVAMAHGDIEEVLALVALIAHSSWSVRAEAIQTLADRRAVQAVPAILRRLETEQDSFVRDAMLRALRQLED